MSLDLNTLFSGLPDDKKVAMMSLLNILASSSSSSSSAQTSSPSTVSSSTTTSSSVHVVIPPVHEPSTDRDNKTPTVATVIGHKRSRLIEAQEQTQQEQSRQVKLFRQNDVSNHAVFVYV